MHSLTNNKLAWEVQFKPASIVSCGTSIFSNSSQHMYSQNATSLLSCQSQVYQSQELHQQGDMRLPEMEDLVDLVNFHLDYH